MPLVLHIFNIFGQLWLWFFDRFIMYPLMRIVAPKLGVRFMNLGYWPSNGMEDLKMRAFMRQIADLQEYESDRSHIYLYEKALSMHSKYPDFENLEILEVSCGQGHSLDWIERHHGPTKRLIGCDKVVSRHENNIVFGDAANLPFSDGSFDFVLNVEAAHLYSDYKKFFGEVSRVLRSGGVFCYLDVRYPHEASEIREAAEHSNFYTRNFEFCTDQVVEGLNYSSRKYDQLMERAPFFVKFFKSSLRATYCAPGTATNDRLRNKQRIYIAAMWIKK